MALCAFAISAGGRRFAAPISIAGSACWASAKPGAIARSAATPNLEPRDADPARAALLSAPAETSRNSKALTHVML
jgi:hypothetical protein